MNYFYSRQWLLKWGGVTKSLPTSLLICQLEIFSGD